VPENGIEELCIIGIEVSVGGNGEADGTGVLVGIAVRVPTISVLTIAWAVSITSAGVIVGVVRRLLQDVKMTTKNKLIVFLNMIFTSLRCERHMVPFA